MNVRLDTGQSFVFLDKFFITIQIILLLQIYLKFPAQKKKFLRKELEFPAQEKKILAQGIRISCAEKKISCAGNFGIPCVKKNSLAWLSTAIRLFSQTSHP
jgi:hypothetical protein